jgi:hypothetical protein
LKTLPGHALSVAVFALLAAVACNGLLGNEEGTPRLGEDAGTSPPPVSEEGGVALPPSQSCDTSKGNKVCFGLCVGISEPNTGCGDTSCAACDPKNVSKATCKGATTTFHCAYEACRAGFDSCDGDDTNGCETSLGAKDSCGSCTTKCSSGDAPFCALQAGGAYACVATCPAGTTPCSGACVDLATSADNCGGCGKGCFRASATATCSNSTCSFTCTPGTHACADACVSDVDPQTCGASCTPCPAGGANTVATCDGKGACGVACAKGFLDCDGKPDNGCEVSGTTCPCACTAKTQHCCANGSCVPIGVICAVLPI